MPNYQLGDIVLVKFPFTNNLGFKKRPALIIKDTHDGDVIVCRITSKLYDSSYDIELKNWHQNGLQVPLVIRVHKMASLEKSMIDKTLGEVENNVKTQVINTIQTLLS
jgi:mRNA interferase MazF